MSDLSEISGRLQRLEWLDEIRQLVAKYALALDMRNLDALVSLFPEDVRVGKQKQGRQALKEWFDDTLRHQFTGTAHVTGNHIIELGQPIQDSKAGGAGAGSSGFGSPQAGDPQVGNSQVGDPQVGDPQVGNPQVGNPQAGDPQVGDPQVGNPQAGDPQVGNPQAGDPQVGNPQVGNPTARGVVYSRNEHECEHEWIIMTMMYWDNYELIDGNWLFRRRLPLYWYATDLNQPPLGPAKMRWPDREPYDGGWEKFWPSWEKFWQASEADVVAPVDLGDDVAAAGDDAAAAGIARVNPAEFLSHMRSGAVDRPLPSVRVR